MGKLKLQASEAV